MATINAEALAVSAANSAEVQAKWDELFQYIREQNQIAAAETQGNFWTQLSFNEAAKATQKGLNSMGQWLKIVNNRDLVQHAKDIGLDAPSVQTEMQGPTGANHDPHWDEIADIFQTPEYPTTEDATNEAEQAQQRAQGVSTT